MRARRRCGGSRSSPTSGAQGHDVTDFKDIRKLDIAQVEAAMPRLDIGYTVFAGIQGGVTGFLSSTGITAAAGGSNGAGIGSLPGIAVTVATFTGDTLLTVASCTRAVAHVAAYYGYDVTKRSEQIIALAVLAVGLSTDERRARRVPGGRRAHHGEDRGEPEAQAAAGADQAPRAGRVPAPAGPDRAARVRAARAGARDRASARCSRRGCWRTVVDTAEHLYRERFLHDKYELPFGVDLPFDPANYRPYVDGEPDDGGEDADDEGDEIFAGA